MGGSEFRMVDTVPRSQVALNIAPAKIEWLARCFSIRIWYFFRFEQIGVLLARVIGTVGARKPDHHGKWLVLIVVSNVLGRLLSHEIVPGVLPR